MDIDDYKIKLDEFNEILNNFNKQIFDYLVSRVVVESDIEIDSLESSYEYKCDLYYSKDGGKVVHPITNEELDYMILCSFTITDTDHELPVDVLYCDHNEAIDIISTSDLYGSLN